MTTAVRGERVAEAPAVVSTVAPRAPTRERLLSLDVFRGMTVAGMLLVNNPGSWGAIYAPLGHAAWHGWTPTDLIFPFFLFIVGITTHISLSARRARGDSDAALVRQILKRGALIFLFGLLLNGFPYYDPQTRNFLWSPVTHLPLWDTVRFLGVLQRIGIVYVCAALLAFRTSLTQQVLIAAGLLFGYWFVMTLVPVPGEGAMGALLLGEPSRTLAAYVDRAVLGSHIYSGTRLWDPEGVLSTFPAIGTAMLGILAGRWITAPRSLLERITGLFVAGALGMMLGLMWNWTFPINKQLWTSSYVLFTGGVACTVLATCMWLIDLHGVKGWTKPFVMYGVNPMIAFVGSGLMARLIYTVIKVDYQGRPTALQAVIYREGFASWIPEPKLASLAFAVTFVLFWLGIMALLYRRKIIFKV